MKIKSIAMFLMFALIPFLASSFAESFEGHGAIQPQQPNKAELLVHLKQIRSTIFNVIQQNFNHFVPADALSNQNFAYTVINEFYDSSDLLQQALCDHISDEFNLLCDNMMPFNQLERKLIYVEPVIEETIKKQLYQELVPIYAKHHKQYCIDNPNGELVKIAADKIFDELLEIIFIIKEPHAWLQKLDAKIAELELGE